MGIHGNESIVGGAASQCTSTRIQSALHLGPGRRVETSVDTAIRGRIRSLEVASLTLLISVMLDKEVPCQIGVLGDLGVVCGNSVVDIGALIVSSFDEQSLVASKSETSGKGTVGWLDTTMSRSVVVYVPSTSTRSDNDIFVASKVNSSSEGSKSCKRADHLLETHCYKGMLEQVRMQTSVWRGRLLTERYSERMDKLPL
jgi:hypothetical protein